jgi:uncharacterized protein YbaR (Trm112 family)
MALINPELLAILACPVQDCHGELEERDGRLLCRRCACSYPIDERWPVLIPEEGERLSRP